jgi:putative ABC transport system permease protein
LRRQAAVGIYGLFAYVVGRRTNELAIRVALGGQRAAIIRMVVGEGLRLSHIGIGVGLLGAIVLARVLSGLLFEVSPSDPATLTAVVALLGRWQQLLATCPRGELRTRIR